MSPNVFTCRFLNPTSTLSILYSSPTAQNESNYGSLPLSPPLHFTLTVRTAFLNSNIGYVVPRPRTPYTTFETSAG